jgi:hypothetical protein
MSTSQHLSHLFPLSLGHYRAMEWNEQEQVYGINDELGILVQVTVSVASRIIRSLVLYHFTGSRK